MDLVTFRCRYFRCTLTERACLARQTTKVIAGKTVDPEGKYRARMCRPLALQVCDACAQGLELREKLRADGKLEQVLADLKTGHARERARIKANMTLKSAKWNAERLEARRRKLAERKAAGLPATNVRRKCSCGRGIRPDKDGKINEACAVCRGTTHKRQAVAAGSPAVNLDDIPALAHLPSAVKVKLAPVINEMVRELFSAGPLALMAAPRRKKASAP